MNMTKAIEELSLFVPQDFLCKNEPMSRHTSFQTGGNADLLIKLHKKEALADVISVLRRNEVPFFVMGNGTNLLVGDGGIHAAVIQICSQMQQIRVEEEKIYAEAGALLSSIAAKAAEASLEGFAFAAGIPGSLGGAVVMNAGAYGGEMKDVLESVEVLTKDLQIITLPKEALALSYRHSSIAEHEYVVLSAVLRLKKGDPQQIRSEMASLAAKRREKQPLQYPSAGSTFKRPEGYFAGKLIEDAGLKGKTIGGAQVSEKHAGFIINRGSATTKDILELIAYCQKTVLEKFGVKLETEVKFLGETE